MREGSDTRGTQSNCRFLQIHLRPVSVVWLGVIIYASTPASWEGAMHGTWSPEQGLPSRSHLMLRDVSLLPWYTVLLLIVYVPIPWSTFLFINCHCLLHSPFQLLLCNLVEFCFHRRIGSVITATFFSSCFVRWSSYIEHRMMSGLP